MRRQPSSAAIATTLDNSKACEVQASVGSNPTVTAYDEPPTCENSGRRLAFSCDGRRKHLPGLHSGLHLRMP